MTRLPHPSPRRLALRAAACVSVLALLAPAAATSDPETREPATPEPVTTPEVTDWLVTLADSDEALPGTWVQRARTSTRVATIRRTAGVREARPLGGGRVLHVTADPGETVPASLADLPGVVAVEPNGTLEFHNVPDDPSYPLQWAHQRVGSEIAWDAHTGGATLGETRPLMGIIDSGIDGTHPDLEGVVDHAVQVVRGEIRPGTPSNDACEIGHGTLTSGVAAARGNNALGVTGIAWNARIIDVAVTDTGDEDGRRDCSGPNDVDTIAAIEYLTDLDEPPLVMNLSLGAPNTVCPSSYQAAIDRARAAGIVIVSSAGNRPSDDPSMPASCNGVISVSATDRGDARASYSQRNPYIDLTAPGGQVDNCPSTFDELAAQAVLTTSFFPTRTYNFSIACKPTLEDPNGDRLEAQVGTSFSTPQIAGAVALLRAMAIDLGRPLDVDQVEALLEQTAEDIGVEGRDAEFGWGMLDLGAAVQRLIDDDVPAAPEPDPDFPVEAVAVDPVRVAGTPSADGATDPIAQAVALSEFSLDAGSTPYAILARADDFADSLAGPSLGLGVAPLLLTPSTGPLDPRTRAELNRVLTNPEGPTTVVILGGEQAVPPEVADQVIADGHQVTRVAGSGREATSVEAARLVVTLRDQVEGISTRNWVFVASGADFADALTAGQMGARFGIPTLVTPPMSLNGSVAEEITRLAPERVIVLGGPAAITSEAYAQVEALGFATERIAGDTRIGTALGVLALHRAELAADGGAPQADTIAVNIRASFADALTASLLSGSKGSWFLPVDGTDGGIVDEPTMEEFCGVDTELLVLGGTDRISTRLATDLADVLVGNDC